MISGQWAFDFYYAAEIAECTNMNGALSGSSRKCRLKVGLFSQLFLAPRVGGHPPSVCVYYLTGLLAKKAVDAGLTVKPYIKTSLSPGSGVVTYYLRESGVMPYLSQLGWERTFFYTIAFVVFHMYLAMTPCNRRMLIWWYVIVLSFVRLQVDLNPYIPAE